MFIIRGAVGKENALFSYLYDSDSQNEPSNTIKSHENTTQTIVITSKNDSTVRSHVEFPLSLPMLHELELETVVSLYKNRKTQQLLLQVQYSAVQDTIFASLKVFTTAESLLLENECVILDSQFNPDSTAELSDNNQSFVALVYGIYSSWIDISNAVIQPSEDDQSLCLFLQLEANANANFRSNPLLSTLSNHFKINQQTVTAVEIEPTTSESSIDAPKSKHKRKREDEPLLMEADYDYIPPSSYIPAVLNRDIIPLFKKALHVHSATETLELDIHPVPDIPSLETFYNYLQPPVSEQRLEKYTSPRIAATLTPFQTQNVEWMMSREAHVAKDDGHIEPDLSIYTSLPLLYSGSHETDQSGTYIDVITGETSTDRAQISNLIQLSYSGGILSDEMGLGKTVSVLSLIAKHTYNPNDPSHPKKEDIGSLVFSKGTLIIAPGSIISQWRSEIKKHATQLSVFIYEGRRYQKDTDAHDLAKYDIVLAYYEAFRQEIYYVTPARKRPQRDGIYYDRNREYAMSPLLTTFWFRCILDEAQMVEGKLTAVARVAKRIPRWYAWAVTGTPMRSDFNDLEGLYDFISIAPSINKPNAFAAFCKDPQYMTLFYDFARKTIRRNTKHALQNQVHIPKQTRHVVRFPFTTIEQHYYDDLWNECRNNIKLDELDRCNWSVDQARLDFLRPRIRNWLVALRQGCIHPSLIANTALRLKSSKTATGAIQTMTEVLQDMAKMAKVNLDHNQYGYFQLTLNKGGMYEVLKDLEKAIEIYTENVAAVKEIVDARSEDSRKYHIKAKELEQAGVSAKDTLDVSDATGHIKWQTLLHRYYFFMASVYHTMELLDKENEFYSKAADIRRALLESYTEKVNTCTTEMHRAASNIKDSPKYHYGSRQFDMGFFETVQGRADHGQSEYVDRSQHKADLNLLENVKGVGYILDQQLAKILYLRDKIMPILTESLVDSETNAEATGEEYDNSLQEQELCQIYLSAYKSLLQDRRFIINGTTVPVDIASFNDDSTGEDDEDEEENQGETTTVKAKQVEAIEKAFRNQLMAPASFQVECLRDVEVELRDLKQRMKTTRRINIQTLDEEQAYIRSQLPAQAKLVDHLDTDLRKLTQLFNSRISYYKYLQSISDTLLEWQSSNPQKEIDKIDLELEKLDETISHNKSRDMYFRTLVAEQDDSQNNQEGKPKDCLICQDPIVKGMITYCGHSSCYSCGIQWFKTSRRCHTCNSAVKPNEWYRVSYREMEMQDRDQLYTSSSSSSSSSSNSNSNGNNNSSNNSLNGDDITEESLIKKDQKIETLVKEIKKQQISSSQGAKIDSIIRHIKYIKTQNNGKCVVFSQWTKVLSMIKTGLTLNKIKCTTVDAGAGSAASKNKAEKFQQDPDMNVILLHARSQSSGLTLVAAHTVFIVEPVLNESLEKQAINRIHRIGQTEETSVFWYIVQDTIEERIHAIHDIKRHNNKKHHVAADVEKAQLSKASDGGGEFVNGDDLRRCFTSDLTYALHK